jgi:ribonuclease R
MLPEILSNGLCSLNPLVDRLAMVCEMNLSRAGKMTGYQFYEAVIHSHARLTYTKVSQYLETPDSPEAKRLAEQLPGVVPHLNTLYDLYKVLLAARHVRGANDFETQETRIVFGADRKISEIRPTQRNDAHKLIEECMLAANVATARFLEKLEIPALYRVHDGPPQEKLNNLRQFLGELGLALYRGKGEPTPGDYQALLESIQGRPDFQLIQTVMLRSLSQAVYSPENHGHFGLNYEAYTHFTSPIRRYPDLLVHRAIRSVIRSKRETDLVQRAGAAAMAKARIYPYDEPRLEQLGEQCSMTERRADEATRDVTNWLKCEYMRDRVGETFDGVITAVTGFGIFVELTDIYVEGLVHVTALPGDYYHFDAVHHRLAGERTGRSFRLGDITQVVVARVDLDERKIDFELAENALSAPIGRKKRGDKAETAKPGKPAKAAAKPARAKGQPRELQLEVPEPPLPVAPPRKRKVGVVQALPSVAPEMLAKADEMLGNTDVNRSRALKQALLDEAKVGGKRPPAKAQGKPAKNAKAAAEKPRKPSKQKAKAAKPSKHRKGPSKPKAEGAAAGKPKAKP